MEVTTLHGSKPGANVLTLVCRPTPIVRFMHRSETQLKATSVSHGTTGELGSIFSPAPENPPKCYAVENVQKNHPTLLLHGCKSGNEPSAFGQQAFHPLAWKTGAFRREDGNQIGSAPWLNDAFTYLRRAIPVEKVL